MTDARKLLSKFEYDGASSMTREELIELVEHLMNNIGEMSSRFNKIIAIAEGIPCKEVIVTDAAHGKILKLCYEVSDEFMVNELEKYDFHALKKRELE